MDYLKLLDAPAGRFHGRKYMRNGVIGTLFMTMGPDDGTYTMLPDAVEGQMALRTAGRTADQVETFVANYDALAGLSTLSGGDGGGGGGDSPRVRKKLKSN